MKREIRDLFYSVVTKKDYLRSNLGVDTLLLTAPHGGGIRPFNIPKRKYGQKLMDTYTRRLTDEIISIINLRPYYVIADIHRNRVDLNRNIEEACQGNTRAKKIWYDWDILIREYKYYILDYNRKGLHIDIHSHNNSNEFQLGYNLSARNYIRLCNGNNVRGSTLDSIENYNLRDMIFGSHSINNILISSGYKVFFPRGNETYFNGGRNIEVYSGNGLGSIQIECPVSVLRYDRKNVAKVLSKAIEIFMEEFL